MRHGTVIVLAGCLSSLILGLMVAYPLLSELPPTRKQDLGVDVVYAYFGGSDFNENIIGLYRNYSGPQEVVQLEGGRYGFDVRPFSYLIILNITNYSNNIVNVNNFDLVVGPQVSGSINGGLSAVNPIIKDSRRISNYPIWDSLWPANASRLIYLSGFIGTHDIAYSALKGGHLDISAGINGVVYGENTYSVGHYIKRVQLQTYGEEYLYNALLSGNQTLVFYGDLDVQIGLRQPA